MAVELIECGCCQGGKRPFCTAEGKRVPCPYCKDSGKQEKHVPHPTHKMSEWHTEVLAPCGEPRFYSVRECLACGEEEWQHAAGHFLHNLEMECRLPAPQGRVLGGRG